MKYFLIAFLFLSCTKSADDHTTLTDQIVKKTNTTLESKYLVKDLGITTVTITLDPMVTCYTYRNGQTPKPCDIFIDITCTLSKPISGAITVELTKLNTLEMERMPTSETNGNIVLVIAPNTTKITMSSKMTNPNNQNIPDLFRMVNVTITQPKH